MWWVLALLLVWGDSIPILTYPNVSLGVNDSVLYTLGTLPSKGSIEVIETIQSSGGLLTNLSLLTYDPTDPFAFGSVYGCNTSYDSFGLNITTFRPWNQTVNISTSTGIALVCLVDTQDLPVVYPTEEVVTASITNFNLTVTDQDDRVGSDGTLSNFSFHEVNGTVSPGAGIVFQRVTTSIGTLQLCGGGALTAGVKYRTTNFCFLSNTLVGSDLVTFYAVDKANGTSSPSTLFLTTREVTVCNGAVPLISPNCTSRGFENGTIQALLPNSEEALYPFTYQLHIVALPVWGILYQNVSGVLVALNVNDTVANNAVLTFIPNPGYFNGYYYPNYAGGFFSFNHSNGLPIGTCANAGSGCPDAFYYQAFDAINSTYDIGRVDLVVNRIIIDVMSVCPTYRYSLWGPCISYGDAGALIPIFLAGNDGRVNPEYNMVVKTLPSAGDLYYNLQNSTTFLRGGAVAQGASILTLIGYYPDLLYVSRPGYSNSIKYNVLPQAYYSPVDQYGNLVGNCTNVTNCADTFTYVATSGINASQVSSIGTYRVIVDKPATNQLTVCGVDGFNIWNISCSSFGEESNDIFNSSGIAIYLNVNYTFGANYSWNILQLPTNGDVYYNTGNATQFVYGALVKVNDTFYPLGYGIPDLIYVGAEDYFNDVLYGGGRIFIDQKGVPIGSCGGNAGCPDILMFQAVTPDGRKSNPGTYQIYVDSLVSTAEFSSPRIIEFTPGVPFYFTGTHQIWYYDPDFDIYYVVVQLTLEVGYVGFNGSMDGLTFPTYLSCFNTTGCTGTIQFSAVPSDVNMVFQNLYFFDSLSTNYSNVLQVRVTKTFPNGANATNQFIVDPVNQLVIGGDISYQTKNGSKLEYEYEEYEAVTSAPTDSAGNSGECANEFAKSNAAVSSTNGTVIAIAIGIPVILIVVVMAVFMCYVECRRMRELKTEAKIQPTVTFGAASAPKPFVARRTEEYTNTGSGWIPKY
jgi:hypothetical protein